MGAAPLLGAPGVGEETPREGQKGVWVPSYSLTALDKDTQPGENAVEVLSLWAANLSCDIVGGEHIW